MQNILNYLKDEKNKDRKESYQVLATGIIKERISLFLRFSTKGLAKYHSINKVLCSFNPNLGHAVHIIEAIVLISKADELIAATDRTSTELNHYQGRLLTITLAVEA